MAQIDGNFAQTALPGLSSAIKALALGGNVREQAQLQSGLMSAQAAKAGQDAMESARLAKLRQDPNYLAELDAIQKGLGTFFKADYDVNKAPSGALDLQKLGWQQQVLQNIGNPGTDREKINQGTAVLFGKADEPFAAMGDTGYALNKATGEGVIASPGIAAIYGQKAAADAALKAAQARDAGRKWDSARGGFADAGSGTFQPAQVPGGGPLPPANDPSRKPLPSAALKMQQEALEAMGLVGSINADLGAIQQQVREGKLDLGPMANKISEGRNWAGISSENSRAYASFMSTLEKLRNDSLRLNKGVQTEGDAQRAWNELLANVNDPKLVEQRLGEILAINQRAAELRGLANDSMRANFGHDPMDYSQYLKLPAAVGQGGAPAAGGAAPTQRTVTRRGKIDGRPVVQYSDGSIEYVE
ncbi:hypothetical protein LMG7053_04819 [Achromobacter ruhlandii]|uniref:DNA transfer protein n=1 Tax=Achromobacter ruhlandii TaxID=72557 RepID=A0ABM8M1L1_9BURK|nr:hypothetical protein [Achromobacter ruhlandii]CAB3955830.1 hypothetical protein LMG7053_04819 [Achromobacter ruhlandii]